MMKDKTIVRKPDSPNFAKKLLLFLTSIIFALAIGEIALRLLGHKRTGSLYTTDRQLGWALRPGAGAWVTDEGFAWSKINSHGFRDRERTLDKPPGVYRVAVVGDSFTQSCEVDLDKTFTALAERDLNLRTCCGAREVEVLNFGVSGYGTSQELLLLRHHVWKFNPDLVVLQIFPCNDLFNNIRALNPSPPDQSPYFLLRNGKLELDESFRHGIAFNPTYIKLKDVSAEIVNNSELFKMIFQLRLVYGQRERNARMEGVSNRPSDPNAPPPDFQQFLFFQPPAIPPMVEAWQVTEAVLAEFYQEVRARHALLLILLMPASPQIHYDPKERDRFCAKFNLESLDYADERIEQHACANGIPAMRLSKPLLEEAVRTRTFMYGFANTRPNDGHVNERGHEVIAREMVKAIREIACAGDPVTAVAK